MKKWFRAGQVFHVCARYCRPNADGCCWNGGRLPHTLRATGLRDCIWCGWIPGMAVAS